MLQLAGANNYVAALPARSTHRRDSRCLALAWRVTPVHPIPIQSPPLHHPRRYAADFTAHPQAPPGSRISRNSIASLRCPRAGHSAHRTPAVSRRWPCDTPASLIAQSPASFPAHQPKPRWSLGLYRERPRWVSVTVACQQSSFDGSDLPSGRFRPLSPSSVSIRPAI